MNINSKTISTKKGTKTFVSYTELKMEFNLTLQTVPLNSATHPPSIEKLVPKSDKSTLKSKNSMKNQWIPSNDVVSEKMTLKNVRV